MSDPKAGGPNAGNPKAGQTPADGQPGAGARPVEAMSFEEAMAELEEVVSRLEHGEASLDESITLYERGALLRAHCDARLKAAEERVEAITLDDRGQPRGTKPVEGL